jgi:hypothetical protein
MINLVIFRPSRWTWKLLSNLLYWYRWTGVLLLNKLSQKYKNKGRPNTLPFNFLVQINKEEEHCTSKRVVASLVDGYCWHVPVLQCGFTIGWPRPLANLLSSPKFPPVFEYFAQWKGWLLRHHSDLLRSLNAHETFQLLAVVRRSWNNMRMLSQKKRPMHTALSCALMATLNWKLTELHYQFSVCVYNNNMDTHISYATVVGSTLAKEDWADDK